MCAFAYVVPLAPDNDFIIIYVDMVLPMVWVDSPKFFCAFSEILTDVANAPVETELPVPAYGSITKTPSTRPAPPHTCERLTHIDCYTDDTISAVKGGPERQHQVFDGTSQVDIPLKTGRVQIIGERKETPTRRGGLNLRQGSTETDY